MVEHQRTTIPFAPTLSNPPPVLLNTSRSWRLRSIILCFRFSRDCGWRRRRRRRRWRRRLLWFIRWIVRWHRSGSWWEHAFLWLVSLILWGYRRLRGGRWWWWRRSRRSRGSAVSSSFTGLRTCCTTVQVHRQLFHAVRRHLPEGISTAREEHRVGLDVEASAERVNTRPQGILKTGRFLITSRSASASCAASNPPALWYQSKADQRAVLMPA